MSPRTCPRPSVLPREGPARRELSAAPLSSAEGGGVRRGAYHPSGSAGPTGFFDPPAPGKIEDLVFLTQDAEFEDAPEHYRATVIISRVRQALPIRERVAIWLRALDTYRTVRPAGKLFELLETGDIAPLRGI
jgi:hypothetical protein